MSSSILFFLILVLGVCSGQESMPEVELLDAEPLDAEQAIFRTIVLDGSQQHNYFNFSGDMALHTEDRKLARAAEVSITRWANVNYGRTVGKGVKVVPMGTGQISDLAGHDLEHLAQLFSRRPKKVWDAQSEKGFLKIIQDREGRWGVFQTLSRENPIFKFRYLLLPPGVKVFANEARFYDATVLKQLDLKQLVRDDLLALPKDRERFLNYIAYLTTEELNTLSSSGQTPLHMAAMKLALSRHTSSIVKMNHESLEKVKILIHAGSDPTLPNGDGFTPLDLAMFAKNRLVMDYLVPYYNSEIPELPAIFLNRIDLVENALIVGKLDPNELLQYGRMSFRPLHLACVTGNLEMYRLLESYGGGELIGSFGEKPKNRLWNSLRQWVYSPPPTIIVAMQHDSFKIFDYLLAKKESIPEEQWTRLVLTAGRKSNSECFLKRLAKAGIGPGKPPLVLNSDSLWKSMVIMGNEKSARFYLNRINGDLPLWAAVFGFVDRVSSEYSPEETNNLSLMTYMNIMEMALTRGHVKSAKKMLDLGVKPSRRVISRAVSMGALDIVEFLSSSGLDVPELSNELLYAVAKGCPKSKKLEMLALLIREGVLLEKATYDTMRRIKKILN